ncbi:Cache 3/Cache 2 fusion domain-containing protein [Pseudomonas sp. KNUC1026]|uniref:Cache 3/Cache 2 fusion domain-containing protein n=1 Tax=Pseudomonas sp. KNUC1026 TaxID=2893890 RepID=UPI003FA6EC1A
MNQPRARIASQLGLALAAILVVVISLSTVFALRSLNAANLATREDHMASEARLLADQLDTFQSTLRISTQRLSGLFESRFGTGLAVQPDQPVNVAGVATPTLALGGTVLNNDTGLVDDFRKMTEGVATVFVRSGDEFVRISTSLTKQDGSRAIGTQLDHAHPAYQRLLAGQGYVGAALLFGRNYMTQYTPVRDAGGKVIAVLFVGFDYTEAQTAQFEKLKQFRIGDSGSLALLDAQNHWLVPPLGAREPDKAAQTLAPLLKQPGVGAFWSDGQESFYSLAEPFAAGPWSVGSDNAQGRAGSGDLGSRRAPGDWQPDRNPGIGGRGRLVAAPPPGTAQCPPGPGQGAG